MLSLYVPLLSIFFYIYLQLATSSESVYDKHGCCLSQGEFYCDSSRKCVSEWDYCSMGEYDADSCEFIYSPNNKQNRFTYNFLPYRDNLYKITDLVSHRGQIFEYYFRLCKSFPIALLPKVCNNTRGSGNEICSSDSMAYQYYSTSWDYEACYRLSGCFDDKPTLEMGILDPVQPASGIYIKYHGGNTCPNSYSDKGSCNTLNSYCSRSFQLNINCHNEIDAIPEHEEIVENAGCEYVVTINHVMGCPVQCPRNYHNIVCSGKGSCFFNYDKNDVNNKDEIHKNSNESNLECLCMDGYTGPACDVNLSPNQIKKNRSMISVIFLGLLITCYIGFFLTIIFIYFECIQLFFFGLYENCFCNQTTALYSTIPPPAPESQCEDFSEVGGYQLLPLRVGYPDSYNQVL